MVPLALARTWISLGPGVLLPTSLLPMLSPGQEAQNIHAHPSKSHPCLSTDLTGPSFCSTAAPQAPAGPAQVPTTVLGPASLPLLLSGPASNWVPF